MPFRFISILPKSFHFSFFPKPASSAKIISSLYYYYSHHREFLAYHINQPIFFHSLHIIFFFTFFLLFYQKPLTLFCHSFIFTIMASYLRSDLIYFFYCGLIKLQKIIFASNQIFCIKSLVRV